MKGIICRFTYYTTIAITAIFLCMTIMLASPLVSMAESGTPGTKSKASEVERVEARINDIHAKLKITAAQEEQWTKVAEVMRDNATTMDAAVKARKEQGNALNAVEDLKSYSKITDAHAAGLNKFIPVFEALYASMSDDQKKNADMIFTKHGHKKPRKK